MGTGDILNTLTGHTDRVNSVVFSPDGKTLASGGGWDDNTVRLWDIATGETRHTLTGHTAGVWSVVFSPDGKTLASGSRGEIRLWDVATGDILNTLTENTWFVPRFVFSPDGTTLASGRWQKIRLWDVATGDILNTLTGHTRGVWSVVFSPDGTTLASGGGFTDDIVRLWNVATGLASGGGFRDDTVRLWNVATGEMLYTLTGHTDGVWSVVFSPDGSILASGSRDGTVLLWNLAPPAATPEPVAKDINGDGVVNIQDLTLVAAQFGQAGEDTPADVNGDGVVDIQDLVLVAAAFEEAAAAPMFAQAESLELGRGIETGRSLLQGESIKTGGLQAADVEQWLTQARGLDLANPSYQRGIAKLEQLLAAIHRRDIPVPKETVLLANYPNPFNPETWIPYELAAAAKVTLTIHAADGRLVRTLALGQLPAGTYQSRSRAAYWDGRNAQGEPVASGVYFYTLQAGDFIATKKMVIWK